MCQDMQQCANIDRRRRLFCRKMDVNNAVYTMKIHWCRNTKDLKQSTTSLQPDQKSWLWKAKKQRSCLSCQAEYLKHTCHSLPHLKTDVVTTVRENYTRILLLFVVATMRRKWAGKWRRGVRYLTKMLQVSGVSEGKWVGGWQRTFSSSTTENGNCVSKWEWMCVRASV